MAVDPPRDPRQRRRLGRALTAYGIVGLTVLVVVAAGMTMATIRARDVLDRIERQRDAIVSSLDATTLLLRTSVSAADRTITTLDSSESAVRRGAELTRTLAIASEGMEQLAVVEILGTQPLAGIAGPFEDLSAQATSLAGSLESTAAALEANQGDLASLSADLEDIRTELAAIRDELDDVAIGGGTALTVGSLVVYVLLAWLAVPALAALVVGVRLARPPGRYPPPVSDGSGR